MEVGRAFVSIKPDFSGFKLAFDQGVRRAIGNGTVKINADVDTHGLKRSFDDVGREAGHSGSRVGKAFGGSAALALRGTALAAGAVATGVVLVGKQAVTAGAQFDATMRQMAAVAGVPAKELDGLRTLALKMGADTVFSAQQAGEAMLELSKGGLSAAQIKAGALKSTLTLAAAGGVDLASAAGYMSNALNSFGLKAKDASRVAAAFAGGANASTASVESLGLALAQVGPGARSAGLSLQETVAVLSAFDNAGIKGSDAGTSLKTMLTRLVPTTKKARQEMAKLGLDFVDAHGNILPVTAIAQQLKDKLSGLSDAQRISSMATIFGSDATRAATVLMNEGAKGIGTYIKATNDQGAATRIAASRMGGMAGAIEQMKGALETAKIVLGTAFAPVIIAVAKGIGGFANVVSTQLIPVLQGFSKTQGPQFRSVFGSIASALSALATTVGSVVAPVFRGLAKVFTDQLVPAIRQALPFVRDQLVIGIKSLTKAIEDNRPQLQKLGALLVQVAGFIASQVVPVLIKLYALHLRTMFEKVGVVIRVIGALITAFSAWWKAMSDTVRQIIGFNNAVTARFEELRRSAGDKIAAIIKFFRDLPTNARNGFNSTIAVLKSAVQIAFETIRAAVGGKVQAVVDLVRGLSGRGRDAFNSTVGTLKAALQNAFESMRAAAGQKAAAIIQLFKDLPGRAKAGFLAAAGGLVSSVAGKFEEIKNRAKGPINGLIDLINRFIAQVNRLPGVNFTAISRLNDGGSVLGLPAGFSARTAILNSGGRVPGGGPNRDTVPAMLTPGEFVIQRSAARQLGPTLLKLLNQAHRTDIGGDESGLRVLRRAAGGGIPTVQQWIRQQDPKPYIWGGTGPRGFDCSGLTSAVMGRLTGRGGGSGQRYHTTSSNFGASGWKRGTGTYTVGVDPGHHMAGNLAGLGFEARSTKTGIFTGGAAKSVSRFPQQWYLPQAGGAFVSSGGGGGGALAGIAKAALNTILGPIRGGINAIPDGIAGRVAKALGNKALDALVAGISVFHQGGIVSKPTLGLVGEKGPEAIVPLKKLPPLMADALRTSVVPPLNKIGATLGRIENQAKVRAEDGTMVPKSFYKTPVKAAAKKVRAEDGTYVPASFYKTPVKAAAKKAPVKKAAAKMVRAEDGTLVPASFYSKVSAGYRAQHRFHKGGVLPSTGWFYGQRGEKVLTRAQTGGSDGANAGMSVVINVNGAGDPQAVADRVSQTLFNQYRTLRTVRPRR